MKNELEKENSLLLKKAGDKFPEFNMINNKFVHVSLDDLISRGSVLIVYVRGMWCTDCLSMLKQLKASINTISAMGVRVAVVTCDLPKYTSQMADKINAGFMILSDIGCKLAKELGITRKISMDTVVSYMDFDIDLTLYHGNFNFELPMANVYVVNSDKTIVYDEITIAKNVLKDNAVLVSYASN